ncbi:polysaccharide deacetylase family protein [Alicyclobacillus fastidiosus]|uniref:Polysaccharide deacetylase family protein n=1 Tax=Alicyclobacillus fastidiosus TaxID=392011 RepID=A0ABY6ZN35_9BACL|nr:polysaccharide deacetylase family protein [Alicyclobacillus fastidiosus]WAH43514.1 polysaccharide deacetylase family protein [Alicyclobacillus fastidiosus]GMA59676.1 polysaccharide deacetylase [Alicyclobacillus fastidiosus]
MRDCPRYKYRAIVDHRPFHWPGGSRVALWVINNIEYFEYGSKGLEINEGAARFDPDIVNHSLRDYGPRVAIWRMVDCFDRLGIRVTVALNADVCEHYPQIIHAGLERKWEWMGHGPTNGMRLAGLSEENERMVIRDTLQRIERSIGTRPKGWLSPGLVETHNTLDILAEEGISYVADWVADDIPFFLTTKYRDILSVPYSMEINDMGLILRQKVSGSEFRTRIIDQFETLYEEGERCGRVMAIALHPVLTGQPHRIK